MQTAIVLSTRALLAITLLFHRPRASADAGVWQKVAQTGYIICTVVGLVWALWAACRLAF